MWRSTIEVKRFRPTRFVVDATENSKEGGVAADISSSQTRSLTKEKGKKPTIGTPRPFGPFIGTLHTALRKGLLGPPVIGQRCIVPMSGSKLLGKPMAGYSSWPSPLNGSKCTYKWLGQYLFWSLKYRHLCTPNGGCQPGVTSPVNTNARIDYEPLRKNAACILRQHRSPT